MTPEDYAILKTEGCEVPSGRIARTAEWSFLMGGTDRLIDLLAREMFETKLALVPADTSIVSGDLAARLCRALARTAVAKARLATASWEAYADDLTEACKPRVSWEAGTYQAARFAESVERFRPSSRQVIVASCDPQGGHRWSQALEARGTRILKACNLPYQRPDVLPRFKSRFVCLPDRVAYRGEDRFELPQPCRYGRNGLQPAVETALHVWYAGTAQGLEATARPVSEHLTTMPRETTARHGTLTVERDEEGKIIARRIVWTTEALPDDRVRQGWRGHKRITWEAAPRKRGTADTREDRRHDARTARHTMTTTKRGPAVGPWALKPSSLYRAALPLKEAWQAIERALLAVDHETVTFTDGTTVEVISAGQVLASNGRAYPLSEWSKRAALAGTRVA